MRNHLVFLLTLSALLTYRPGYAQANSDMTGTPGSAMVASVRTKPVSSRVTSEGAATKTMVTTKKGVVTSKKAEGSLSRFWSRIMSHCREVHSASQKKS